ncbi:SDR family NAD(P)-dependent oxidoreductase [Allokutzneria sp. A3M-2-11 16]|uniref:SDR family NAD(P)-dependent oxidoreductase n=1 Tax=Allokutzneria sp. A3M-2-11 16 TaxID=2962043 RepID=UPI0020B6C0AC|nr:SDR family NAD(P)-dependent oxidoreductase [Allokutzneria sp. A3M-2-11 16]MCP3799621.1 SDR family NAD(P)-dependent oxidoreductase [Allokutzneria sp. A3M-2-11 16]
MTGRGVLERNVVVVTGAGQGLGRAIALECAREGAAVVVADMTRESATSVAEQICAEGGQSAPVYGDVTDSRVAERLVRVATDRFGGLDALVNNADNLRAGNGPRAADTEWDEVVRGYVNGGCEPSRAVCRYWKDARRPGRMAHTTSALGFGGRDGYLGYGAAKLALSSLSAIVSMEMAPFGVTSNVIAPVRRTRNFAALPRSGDGAGGPAAAARDFELFTLDNCAALVAFLVSEASAYISGKVFGVQESNVEIYQSCVAAAEITAGSLRWSADELVGRIDELFFATGIQPGAEYRSERMRYYDVLGLPSPSGLAPPSQITQSRSG